MLRFLLAILLSAVVATQPYASSDCQGQIVRYPTAPGEQTSISFCGPDEDAVFAQYRMRPSEDDGTFGAKGKEMYIMCEEERAGIEKMSLRRKMEFFVTPRKRNAPVPLTFLHNNAGEIVSTFGHTKLYTERALRADLEKVLCFTRYNTPIDADRMRKAMTIIP